MGMSYIRSGGSGSGNGRGPKEGGMPSMGKGTGAIVASGAHPDRDEIEGRDSCTKMIKIVRFTPLPPEAPALAAFFPCSSSR